MTMRQLVRVGGVIGAIACSLPSPVAAQDLVPGAFTPAPVGFNVVSIVGSVNNGDVAFDPALAVEDGRATVGAAVVAYNRTLSIAGRFGSVGVVAPWVVGHIEGVLLGQFQETSRSGPGDLSARVAINLLGAPAMTREQFVDYRPTTLLGVSVSVGVPVGQYDPARAINIGTNRWTIRPEAGLSRTRGRWTFEGSAGTAFFTDNTDFRQGGRYEQAPIVSMQGHLIYAIRPGMWVAGDGNFWTGGRVTSNGVPAAARQQNSRLGATLAVPIRRRQLRIAYSLGAYTRVGGDFSSLGVSYSYVWAGRP
jgi:hypothetical protein